MSKPILLTIAAVVVILGGFITWVFIESSKSLPGQKVADQGREHVATGTKVDYNSNPPTSGPHYADWVRSGIYTEPKDDRNLVHSLEHGYVIMSYNCGGKISNKEWFIGKVSAHGLDEEVFEATREASGTSSATLGGEFNSEECHKLVDQLIQVYEKKGKRKLIIVPRPNLDARVALTAWTYIDKFDPSTSSGLSASEMERVERFIDAHRDQGPEKTME